MASKILLGAYFGQQWKMDDFEWDHPYSISSGNIPYANNRMVIIAKGNRYAGVTAKE